MPIVNMSKMLMGSMDDQRWFLMNADPPQYMRNAVYLNTGTDRFLEGAYLTAQGGGGSVLVLDLWRVGPKEPF